MKIKQLMLSLKRDDREIGYIFQKAIGKTKITRFNSICGTDVNEETVSESQAFKNARPLVDISLREVSSYE